MGGSEQLSAHAELPQLPESDTAIGAATPRRPAPRCLAGCGYIKRLGSGRDFRFLIGPG
jgi:hypothetical protein